MNKVTRKFTWPMLKVEDIFLKLNGAKYFTMLDVRAGYHHIPLDKSSILKTAFNSPFEKYEYVKVPFGIGPSACILSRIDDQYSERFQFCNSLFGQHHNIQQDSRGTPDTH